MSTVFALILCSVSVLVHHCVRLVRGCAVAPHWKRGGAESSACLLQSNGVSRLRRHFVTSQPNGCVSQRAMSQCVCGKSDVSSRAGHSACAVTQRCACQLEYCGGKLPYRVVAVVGISYIVGLTLFGVLFAPMTDPALFTAL